MTYDEMALTLNEPLQSQGSARQLRDAQLTGGQDVNKGIEVGPQ